MKKMILVASLLLSASVFARTNTADLTCAEAQDLVKDAGAITLSHGDHNLYSRFVKSSLFCNGGEKAAKTSAVTLDNAKCVVGYTCVDREGPSFVVASSEIKKCREGSRASFPVQDNFASDRVRYETRTCTNGRWYPKAPAPRIIKCKDGRRYSGEEYLYGQGYFNVTRECQNGKYVIVRKTPSNGGR